jgi:hypothetical protein
VIVLSSHRIGLELIKMPKAKGTRLAGRSVGGNTKLLPKETTATLAELAGYRMKGHRLKKWPSKTKMVEPEVVIPLRRQHLDNAMARRDSNDRARMWWEAGRWHFCPSLE